MSTESGWRAAMATALYGPAGFFVANPPAAHFRTSVHASPLFAGALAELLNRLDAQLGHPDPLHLVDVGTGRGELPTALAAAVPRELAGRLRLTAVELAPRPDFLPAEVTWRTDLPTGVTGLLLATEWLDNVPLDLAELDAGGIPRYLRTDDSLGDPLTPADAAWLADWWPLYPGRRAELGGPRDAAWRAAVGSLDRGLAVAVDYGHLRADRPPLGTLTGYRDGRALAPVPDGSMDLTAHVAFDALATPTSTLLAQRDALRALGVSGRRPPIELAHTDPAGYLRGLASAGAAGELTDPAGLGGHRWLVQPVGIGTPGWVAGLPCQL